MLISWWTIFYTKWHHHPDKCSLVSDKSSLVSLLKCNKYIMIYWKTIQKWIGVMTNNNIKDFSVNESGYGFFFVATFNFWKSTQIQNLPLFLGTIIISDSYEAFSTSWINPMYNQKFVNMLFDSSNIIGILIDIVFYELTILRYQVH
jgi:hypothetical protein